jgi:hypothetical protein
VERISGLETVLAVSSNRSTQRATLLITTHDVPSYLILLTLTMEAIRSSEMSALTRTTHRRQIPEDCRHNLKSYG